MNEKSTHSNSHFGKRGTHNADLPRALVQFDNVSLKYNNSTAEKNRNLALDKVSLRLERGGFYFLTGPSGAGKSTLLKLMYLALRPSLGDIEMFGINVGKAHRDELPELRRRIGVVFQDFRLLSHLSVFDNLALPFRVRNKAPAEYLDDVEELLSWVGLGKRMNALPETLSGGEQQRVAIARAVVGKPDLLIADEPTGNVDPQMGARLIRLFLELNKLGTTIVIATHDQEMVARSGAPVLRLEHGKLTQIASPSHLPGSRH
jgi:cell division transport system ATP-binding protein